MTSTRPAFITMPGTPHAARIVEVPCTYGSSTVILPAGLHLLAAARQAADAAGGTSAVFQMQGGAFGPFAYVMPALATTPDHAAFYSETFTPPGLTQLRSGALTLGTRDGADFFHCHALWTEASGRFNGGHIMPDATIIPGLEGDDAFVLIGGPADTDGSEPVDALMRAVRCDLRDPLRQAHAALEVALLAGAGPDGQALELEALLDRVAGLLEVADELVDLAHLWGGGEIKSDDRIELWTLLQQVWGEVEPLAMDRRVRVRFTTDTPSGELATLYGHARWIRRVFVDCLKSAVRLAPMGGEMEVAHRQDGATARIVLLDCAPFNPGAPGPGAAAIGHQLCRHVLARHGGRLLEERDGERRHLVIELPTGAPHHNDEARMAIAQAQQYARDLAALRSRARDPQRAVPATAA